MRRLTRLLPRFASTRRSRSIRTSGTRRSSGIRPGGSSGGSRAPCPRTRSETTGTACPSGRRTIARTRARNSKEPSFSRGASFEGSGLARVSSLASRDRSRALSRDPRARLRTPDVLGTERDRAARPDSLGEFHTGKDKDDGLPPVGLPADAFWFQQWGFRTAPLSEEGVKAQGYGVPSWSPYYDMDGVNPLAGKKPRAKHS